MRIELTRHTHARDERSHDAPFDHLIVDAQTIFSGAITQGDGKVHDITANETVEDRRSLHSSMQVLNNSLEVGEDHQRRDQRSPPFHRMEALLGDLGRVIGVSYTTVVHRRLDRRDESERPRDAREAVPLLRGQRPRCTDSDSIRDVQLVPERSIDSDFDALLEGAGSGRPTSAGRGTRCSMFPCGPPWPSSSARSRLYVGPGRLRR